MKAKPKVKIMSSLRKLYHEWSEQVTELIELRT